MWDGPLFVSKLQSSHVYEMKYVSVENTLSFTIYTRENNK